MLRILDEGMKATTDPRRQTSASKDKIVCIIDLDKGVIQLSFDVLQCQPSVRMPPSAEKFWMQIAPSERFLSGIQPSLVTKLE